jgi:hypothetical protein
VKPNVDGHGNSTSCTVTVLGTGTSSSGNCSSTQQLVVALWNTTYTVRVVATSVAGTVQSDISITTGRKGLVIDASSHWPCPGFFCGSSASGFAGPSVFTSYTTHAEGTPVSLMCWTTGGSVYTGFPNASGNETSNVWVKSNEATNPYYSVLYFPTPGETAKDGLPAC